MINDDGGPNTAHTTNPVPVIYVGNDATAYKISNGILADVTPYHFILYGPGSFKEMNGKILLSH